MPNAIFFFRNTKWRLLVCGVLVTALIPLLLHMEVHSTKTTKRTTSMIMPGKNMKHLQQQQQRGRLLHQHLEGEKGKITDNSASMIDWKNVMKAAETAEASILDFFHGEKHALEDGAPMFTSSQKLIQRIVQKIYHCQQQNDTTNDNDDIYCTFRIVFIGGAQMAGRDNLFNVTFPFIAERRLQPILEASGLKLEVLNHAMDSDLNREGPQTAHMCISNFLPPEGVDVVIWGYDDIMQNHPSNQLEAFIRWTLSTSNPAMIILNRSNGPHGASRRGKSQFVAPISPGHNAILYQDQEILPQPRQPDVEPYTNSSKRWKNQWNGKRNSFWYELFHSYESIVDFAAIDPAGSIWFLDHLSDFSNAAFDSDKALSLLDCGPHHPPPCDQIAPAIFKNMKAKNMSNATIPEHPPQGLFCGVKFGCAHYWCTYNLYCVSLIF